MPQYVKDWMNKNISTVDANYPLSAAIHELAQTNQQFLFCKDETGVNHILSNMEINQSLSQLQTTQVKDTMTPITIYAHPEWTLEQALLQMQAHDLRYLPVKNHQNNLVGVLSIESFFIAVQEIKWKIEADQI